MNHDADRMEKQEADAGVTTREGSGRLGASVKVGGAPPAAASLPTDELANRVRRAVMLSMSLTGAKSPIVIPSLYTHDDYDDAMAALNELVRRAK